MSAGWSKLLDAGSLADGRAQMDFAIPLAEFPRLALQLRDTAGEAAGGLSFARESRLAVADVRVSAEVVLTCQRCLQPVRCPIDSEGRAALVATPEEADRVPETLEAVFAEGHRISLLDLVEEELLLALPLVPRHADCGGDEVDADEAAQPDEAAPETHRPFGELAQLLRRR